MKIRYYTNRGSTWLDFKDAMGARKRVPSGYLTQAEAEKNVSAILAKHLVAPAPSNSPAKSSVPTSGGMTIREAHAKAMRERESWIGSKDKASLRLVLEALVAYWGEDTGLHACTREPVLKWRSAMLLEPGKRKGTTLSHSTINHRLSMLSTLLELCGYPPHTVKHLSVKGNGRERRITNTEVQKMKDWLAAHADRVGAVAFCQLITVALECGSRQGELLSLVWADVAEETLTFRDTKNSSSRTVPLTAPAKRVMEARRGVAGGPFKDLTTDQCTKLWAAARDGLGLAGEHDFVFHSLRHECLSRLADTNANAMVIKAIAGHASIVTTQRYVHASLEAMKSAMGVSTVREG